MNILVVSSPNIPDVMKLQIKVDDNNYSTTTYNNLLALLSDLNLSSS